MTRIFPAHRLLQTSNGWKQHLNTSHVLQGYVYNISSNSSNTPPMVCTPIRHFHAAGLFYGVNPLLQSFPLIMFNLILITTITRIVRFLLKPLKQPLLISQIIGGVILGPSFLGRNRWYLRHMTTDSAQFLMNNLGTMGFMVFLFIYGVKMDPILFRKSGKFHLSTALVGIVIPTASMFVVAVCMRKNMDKELGKISSIGIIAGYLGTTAFPGLYHILKELNLLNSEVGRLALSLALIGDALGVGFVVAFETARQGEIRAINALWSIIALTALVMFISFGVRPAMMWINNNTPEGQPVDQSFVVLILLSIFTMGFLTDMLGMAIANGSLWLGLAVPDGPRLGATLVDKCQTIMTDILLPFSFILVGSRIDFYAMSACGWSNLAPLFSFVLVGFLTKFFATWVVLWYWQLPFRDGLTLSLIMSLRGQIELLLFVYWMDKKIIKVPDFTLLMLMTTALIATFTPLISTLYDPTKPYMLNKRRNIQHNSPDEELRTVLCVLDTGTINNLIQLLDISNPTSSSPFSVFALKIFELVGRSMPLFIDHEKQEVPPSYQWTHSISALERLQQLKEAFVKLQIFTVVSPKQSMFQDICELALEQEASLIILPFRRGAGIRTLHSQVLNHAPCSVAILVNKGHSEIKTIGNSFRNFGHRFIVLFLGGADAREALVYADRMVANEDVSLTVIRFLSYNSIGDNEREKKLDDGIVTWFYVKNERNQRVLYKEVVVRSGEETIGAIQDMHDGVCDLWIVGRKQGINPVLLTGLSEWSETEELGVLGDFVSSQDFPGSASVLVLQQQVLRG